MRTLREWKGIYGAAALVILTIGAGIVLWYRATYILDKGVDMTDRREITITLAEKGFDPQYVRIKEGTKVTFVTTRDKQFWPASNPHPTHGLYGLFDPQRPLQPEESWEFMPKKGVWGYHDHVRSYYSGIIYVE